MQSDDNTFIIISKIWIFDLDGQKLLLIFIQRQLVDDFTYHIVATLNKIFINFQFISTLCEYLIPFPTRHLLLWPKIALYCVVAHIVAALTHKIIAFTTYPRIVSSYSHLLHWLLVFYHYIFLRRLIWTSAVVVSFHFHAAHWLILLIRTWWRLLLKFFIGSSSRNQTTLGTARVLNWMYFDLGLCLFLSCSRILVSESFWRVSRCSVIVSFLLWLILSDSTSALFKRIVIEQLSLNWLKSAILASIAVCPAVFNEPAIHLIIIPKIFLFVKLRLAIPVFCINAVPVVLQFILFDWLQFLSRKLIIRNEPIWVFLAQILKLTHMISVWHAVHVELLNVARSLRLIQCVSLGPFRLVGKGLSRSIRLQFVGFCERSIHSLRWHFGQCFTYLNVLLYHFFWRFRFWLLQN